MKTKKKTISELITKYGTLKEQAIARYGNFPLGMEILYTSETVMGLYWDFCHKVKSKSGNYDLYKLKANKTYTVGEWVEIDEDDKKIKTFKRVAEIKLRDESIYGVMYHAVDLVRVNDSYQGSGIATSLYETLVKHEKINLISDTEQYFGARKLWAKLSHKPHLVVDILDTRTCKIEHKGIKIDHGPLDWNVDSRVWSYENDDLVHLRMLLKEIS